MQERILNLFGMFKPSIIESHQQEKENRGKKRSQKCDIIQQQQNEKSKMIKPLKRKTIEVPKEYQDQLYSFQSQKNLYIFANDLPSDYESCQKLLAFCQTIKTSFIFITHYPDFLLKCLHIHFSHLTNLILIQCKLVTIEALSFLDSPSLRNLYLDENRIVCVKPLLKTKFCLSVLSINNILKDVQNNRVNQVDLSRLHMKQNIISATLNLTVHDIFSMESSFMKLFKMQTPLLNISDGKKSQYDRHFRNPKYQKLLEERFLGLKFTLDGISTTEELIESKFEYIYYRKLQKRRDTNFLLHQY